MTLHIESTGDGPDLVLLHGWGMHSGVWDGVYVALAKHFRVHRVDFPGYGKSNGCTRHTLIELVQSLAKAAPESVAVCGWSLGAQVALTWARNFERQVKQLVLVAATPRFVCAPDWPHGMETQVFAEFAAKLKRDGRTALKRFVSLETRGAEDARSQSAWLRKQLFARGEPEQSALETGLRILHDADLRETAQKLRQPVLLLHGAADALVPLGAALWLKQHFPQARLEVFERCAHAPFLSKPGEFVKELAEFLDE
ncbi:MAG TPA: pimeloyl-ACP methyl ester esterase BioH [Burkholderiales bacterium]|nr:pimeloyl-ACP methyl ester esterase BioH [Burkholderiales bacterium]